MKKIVWVLIVLFILPFLAIGGFYPIAVVDYTPISFRTWKKTQESAKYFLIAQNQTEGGRKVINFSAPENHELLLNIEKSSLDFLISDLILQKEGSALAKDFDSLSQKKVDAVTQNPNISQGARVVYGLGAADFKEFVLLPQARIDTARELLSRQGKDFDQWFQDKKKQAKIKLFFVPFEWKDGLVQ